MSNIRALKLSIILLFLFILPAFSAEWAVRNDIANVRTGPSKKAMKIYTLSKDQFIAINDIGRRKDWIKVQFNSYVTMRAYLYLSDRGAEIIKIGREGNLVQVRIAGWTMKDNLEMKE